MPGNHVYPGRAATVPLEEKRRRDNKARPLLEYALVIALTVKGRPQHLRRSRAGHAAGMSPFVGTYLRLRPRDPGGDAAPRGLLVLRGTRRSGSVAARRPRSRVAIDATGTSCADRVPCQLRRLRGAHCIRALAPPPIAERKQDSVALSTLASAWAGRDGRITGPRCTYSLGVLIARV